MVQYVLHSAHENNKTTVTDILIRTHNTLSRLTCLSCQFLQFLYSNLYTIVLQTILSVDVLCGEKICHPVSYQRKRRGDREEYYTRGMKMNNLKNTMNPTIWQSILGKWSKYHLVKTNFTTDYFSNKQAKQWIYQIWIWLSFCLHMSFLLDWFIYTVN